VSALHITNGDCAADTLRTFLADPVLITCDVLHEGPAPRVDGDRWYETRARFLEGLAEGYDAIRTSLAAFDRAVVGHGSHDEIVLWFEHDLFDQLLLIRTLDLIGGRSRPARQQDVSVICIGEFPGVERFIGLGQLNAGQLASLHPTRARVAEHQFALASDAWQAFRADSPLELLAVMVRLEADATARQALPFLHDAIRRLFEEYPSTTNGLSRTANAILRTIASGPLPAGALFRATQADEARPFMGDSTFFDLVARLASTRVPLVTVADLPGRSVAITPAGRDVLAGRADAVALNGIDEWRGGVHLAGADRSPWRWDARAGTLVS
jgi:Domain of unknown function (DUF1835)